MTKLSKLMNPPIPRRLANRVSLRNLWLVLVFDLTAPLATVASLVAIGVALGWPLWWVSACSILMLLVVAGVAINLGRLRSKSITVGMDDDGPRLRLAVAAACTAAMVGAVAVGYTHWRTPDHDLSHESAEVLKIAATVAQNASTFAPQSPTVSLDRATAMMVPGSVIAFTELYNQATAPLAQRLITVEAATLSAGVEAITPTAASVAVVMRGTRSRADVPPSYEVIALRVRLTKEGGRWMVLDLAPVHR